MSIKRVSKFLLLEEIDANAVNRELTGDDAAVSIENGTFGWSSDRDSPILKE